MDNGILHARQRRNDGTENGRDRSWDCWYLVRERSREMKSEVSPILYVSFPCSLLGPAIKVLLVIKVFLIKVVQFG